MYKIHDVDALLILATGLSSKRRPAELLEIMAAIDFLQGNIPTETKLSEAFARLSGMGLILAEDGGFRLSPAAEEMVSNLPKKGEAEERLFRVKDNLSTFKPEGEHAAVAVATDDIKAAIQAHREAGKGGAKNLLMPKPKPVEDKPRPGQRQRKPAPKARRRS